MNSTSTLKRRELIVWGAKLAASALGWYVMSVGLTLFNKWILGCTPELLLSDPEHGCDQYWVVTFKFPVRGPGAQQFRMEELGSSRRLPVRLFAGDDDLLPHGTERGNCLVCDQTDEASCSYCLVA